MSRLPFRWPQPSNLQLPKLDIEPDLEEGGAIADAVRAGSLGFGFSAGGALKQAIRVLSSRLTQAHQLPAESIMCAGMLFPYYIGVLEGLKGLNIATGKLYLSNITGTPQCLMKVKQDE